MLNDLDTYIIYMIKKIGFYDQIFPEIARPSIFISPHSAYRAFCGEIKVPKLSLTARKKNLKPKKHSLPLASGRGGK